jgi:hypothetical protein
MDPIFSELQPPVAKLPHLITALDARLLSGLVSIHGAKLGVWKHPAPFDENDNFLPFRDNVPLSAWALPYNQGELLACRNIVSGESIMIVDSSANEKLLAPAAQAVADSGVGYQDLPELPAIVNAVGWALIPVGQNQDQALFVSSHARADLAKLLGAWCHSNGRAYATVELTADGAKLNFHAPPDETRKQMILQESAEFLSRMALYGISPEEVQAQLPNLIAMMKSQAQAQ